MGADNSKEIIKNDNNNDNINKLKGGRSQRNLIIVKKKLTKEEKQLITLCQQDNLDEFINIKDEYNLNLNEIISKDGSTLLHVASRNGSMKLLEYLINFNLNIEAQENGYGGTPLHIASRTGKEEAVKLLIKTKKDLIFLKDDYGFTPLARAAYEGHYNVCNILIENGSDIKSEDNVKQQPIHRAASRGFANICKLLVENGSDPNSCDTHLNSSPLMSASFYGNEQTCLMLLSLGADTEIENPSHGGTALFAAVRGEHVKIVEILLKNGSNPNHQDQYGNTPLHISVKRKLRVITFLLLKYEANIKLNNNENISPWDISTTFEYGDDAILAVFMEALGNYIN